MPFIVVRPNGDRAKLEVSAKTNFACEDCKLYFKNASGTVDFKFCMLYYVFLKYIVEIKIVI